MKTIDFRGGLKLPAHTPGYDPELAKRARADFGRQARMAGRSAYNRGNRDLRSRGLGRSAGVLNLGALAARTEGGMAERLNLPFALNEQNFAEGQRQFNIQAYLQKAGLGLQRDRLKFDKYRFDESRPGFLDFLGSMLGSAGQVGAAYLGRRG